MAITPKKIIENIEEAQREKSELEQLENRINGFLERNYLPLKVNKEISFALDEFTKKETIEALLNLYRGAGWQVESTPWPNGLPALTFTCPGEFYQETQGDEDSFIDDN